MKQDSAAAGAGSAPAPRAPGKTARIVLVLVHAAALAAVLTEWLYPFPADAHAVERVPVLDFPASYAVYGFTACVILVLLGLLLRRLVMRGEDYYHRGREW